MDIKTEQLCKKMNRIQAAETKFRRYVTGCARKPKTQNENIRKVQEIFVLNEKINKHTYV